MAGTNYMHGVHVYAHNRVPDGSGRDLMILMDKGWRMGRNQDGFGSIVSAKPKPHPLFGQAAPSRSLLETDPHWTDVYGKRPAAKTQGHNVKTAGEDEPRICRMQGGNCALLLPKPLASPAALAPGVPGGSGLARSRSEPGGGLKAASDACRWRTRETFMAFESWSGNAPTALAAPAKGRKRATASASAAGATLRPH